MTKRVFVISLIVATLLQGYWWYTFDIIDGGMWGKQAEYVEKGDFRQFDPTFAYNPPGGPIIIGSIAIHHIFRISYRSAVLVFLSLINGLIISSICTLCYLMRRDSLWYIIVLGLLSFNRLYENTTPPSAMVSLLIVLLFILSLYIYENRSRATSKILFLWSLVTGLAVATRVEIGIFAGVFFALISAFAVGLKKILYVLMGSLAFFIIFNPFMWQIPFKHIADIFSKVFLFHGDHGSGVIPYSLVLSISSLAFMGIILAFLFMIYSKNSNPPIPTRVILILFAMTAILYGILLTSSYQPARYFVPVIFIWETLLPLYLMTFFAKVRPDFLKNDREKKYFEKGMQVFAGGLLIGFQLAIYYVIV